MIHLSYAKVDFNCPKCNYLHKEEDYFERYRKCPYNKTFYMNCKGCKTKLGIDQDIKADVVVWLKEDELKTK